MSKKKTSFSYFAYIPIITLAITTIAGFVRFQVQAENTKVKVEELKADVKEIAATGDKKIEELKDKTKETDKKVEVNKTQQDNMQAQIQQISEKTDKIVDLLIEIKQRKK